MSGKLVLNFSEASKKYYIYSVSDETGVIFFTYDKLVNILNFKKLCFQPGFDIHKDYTIELISHHYTLIEAINVCNDYVRKYYPNIPVHNYLQYQLRGTQIICNETGVTYRNAAEACNALNIQAGIMSRHLRRMVGAKTVRGLTFSYVAKNPQVRDI